MKPLRGRLIAEIIPEDHREQSGIIIVDRKAVPVKATVLAVGANSMKANGEPKLPPAAVGDIIHFKKYTPMFHQPDGHGVRKGAVTLWWDDVIAKEINDEN